MPSWADMADGLLVIKSFAINTFDINFVRLPVCSMVEASAFL